MDHEWHQLGESTNTLLYRCAICGFLIAVPRENASGDEWKEAVGFSCGEKPRPTRNNSLTRSNHDWVKSESSEGRDIYVCSQCRQKMSLPADWDEERREARLSSTAECPGGAKREPPTIAAKIVTYRKAIQRWRKAGKPKRNNNEVEQLLAICKICQHFTKWQTCGICGCRISRNRSAYLNKLRMATEACPIGKWQAKVDPPEEEEDPAKPLIAVIGIHRTLSSAFAESLMELGIYFGEPNTRGEFRPLVRLLETADPFPAVPRVDHGKTLCRRLGSVLKQLLDQAGDRQAAVKYPLLAGVLDDLQKSHTEIRWIFLDRPLDDSIQSLVDRTAKAKNDRWKATPAQCWATQRELKSRADEFFSKVGHLRVDVDKLIDRPRAVLKEVAAYLDLRPTSEQLNKASRHIQSKKATHRGSPSVVSKDIFEVLVKSFKRPECLLRFLRSVRKFYPDILIRVADDSLVHGEAYSWEFERCKLVPNIEWYQLPFDTGLSAGRNFLVKQAKTPYVLICDDDFVFTKESRIERMIAVLETEEDLIGVSGCVRPSGGQIRHWAASIDYDSKQGTLSISATKEPWKLAVGVRTRQADTGLNFLLARTQSLLEHPWDEQFLIGKEHLDWNLSIKQAGLKIAYTTEAVVGQWKQNDDNYTGLRFRNFNQQFEDKWGLRDKFKPWMSRCNSGESLIVPPKLIVPAIHHFLIEGKRVKPTWHRFRTSWRALHPRWEHCLWNDFRLKMTMSSQMVDLYNSLEDIEERTWLAKLWVLGLCGGVCVDFDMEPLQPLDPLLGDCESFASRDPEGKFFRGVFGCSLNYEPVKEVLEGVGRVQQSEISQSLMKGLARGAVFPAEVFCPVPRKDKELLKTGVLFPEAYTICHHALSKE